MKKSFAVKKLTSAEMAKALTSNVHADVLFSVWRKCMQILFLCYKQHLPTMLRLERILRWGTLCSLRRQSTKESKGKLEENFKPPNKVSTPRREPTQKMNLRMFCFRNTLQKKWQSFNQKNSCVPSKPRQKKE